MGVLGTGTDPPEAGDLDPPTGDRPGHPFDLQRWGQVRQPKRNVFRKRRAAMSCIGLLGRRVNEI